MKPDRRNFLKSATAIGAGLSIPHSISSAAPENVLSEDRMGVLVDTTVCIGCRHCEWACRKSHDMDPGELDSYSNREVYKKKRHPNENELCVINEYANSSGNSKSYVKYQCMHCDKPACVSACIVGAITKQKNGSVIWDTDKCIGCRYCMVACPFQVPAFEYDVALKPDIKKCDLCFERTAQGYLPACIEICPMEVMTYGPRSEIIKLARERIRLYPERYKDYIYGENEVGGTSWVYIASENYDKLQLPKLPDHTAPGVSESIQHGIFAYFVPPIGLYALLGGIMYLTKNRKNLEDE